MGKGWASGYYAILRSLKFSPYKAVVILVLSIGSTLFEGVGLTMFLPVLQFIQHDGDIEQLRQASRAWAFLAEAYATLKLPLVLETLLATAFVAIVLRQITAYARQIVISTVTNGQTKEITTLGFNKTVGCDVEYLDRQQVGEIVNDFTTATQLAVIGTLSSVTVVGYIFTLAVYSIILLMISVKMTVIAILIIGLASLSARRLIAETHIRGRVLTEFNKLIGAFFTERLQKTHVIRLSGTAAAEAGELRRLAEGRQAAMVDIARLEGKADAIIEPAVAALAIGILYLSVQVIHIPLESIGLFVIILVRLLPIVRTNIATIQKITGVYPSMRSVSARLAELEAAQEAPGGDVEFTRLARGIDLRDVHYCYQGKSVAAVNGVSLFIPAGQITALVGPSGAGKSTVIDLIARHRRPQGGDIHFDDVAVEQFTLKSLRRGVAFMPQAPQILNVTPAEHIGLSDAQADRPMIEAAARRAGCHDFIAALPNGYDTRLSGNAQLSGGQRQLLDLARVLLQKAPLIIMDEPTSAIDPAAELAFRGALKALREQGDRTIVIIGHRLSTVAEADRIIVFCEGRIAEMGTHAELRARKGWYADAVVAQTDSLVSSS